MLRLDEPAPGLRLRNQHGIATGLAELCGHIVVMWWQRSFDHPHAAAVARSLRDRHPDLTARNAAVLGLSGDSGAEVARFHRAHGLTFDVLSDAAGAAAAAYRLGDWWRADPDSPLTLVVDAGGLIRGPAPRGPRARRPCRGAAGRGRPRRELSRPPAGRENRAARAPTRRPRTCAAVGAGIASHGGRRAPHGAAGRRGSPGSPAG